MNLIKLMLVKLGSILGERTIYKLKATVSYLEVGRWMSAKGFYTSGRVKTREEIFHRLAGQIANQRILYLEFGVAFGDSMRCWSRLLKNPGSHLDGFDSFEGLPFSWNAGDRKGAYSANGVIPQIPDPRVRFFKGLFHETLPTYEFPDYDVLVVNIDCDLYSSAAVVLKELRERIRPGVYVYFDEFCDYPNELRAFDEFIESTGKRFELLGASRTFKNVLFRCVSDADFSKRESGAKLESSVPSGR